MDKKLQISEGQRAPGENSVSVLPIPFSEEKLHQKVAYLLLHQVRVVNWLTGQDTGWRIFGKTHDELDPGLYSPQSSAEEAGLLYADVQSSNFAQCMEGMYQLAYYGILDESRVDSMDYETLHTWTAAILKDMASSHTVKEWDDYGDSIKETAQECLAIAELADARLLLEGREGFIEMRTPNDQYLTIRQLALLAGMEEMTVRSAANPKRINPLQTYTEANNTRITIEAAKDWLKAKGRYVLITKKWGRGDINLAKHRFSSLSDLLAVVSSREQFLIGQGAPKRAVEEKLLELLSLHQTENTREWLSLRQLSNPELVRELAAILDFPPDLFSLRVRELLIGEEMKAVEQELRQLTLIGEK